MKLFRSRDLIVITALILICAFAIFFINIIAPIAPIKYA